MHDDLLDYFQKQQQHLEHYLAMSVEEPEPEMVHQLRVCIKRLRAVLHFTGEVTGNEEISAKKQGKSLRKLFKVAGSLRDIQVQLKQIQEYESSFNFNFHLYLSYLKKLEKQSVKNFNTFIEEAKPIHKLSSRRELIEKSIAVLSPEEIRLRAEALIADRCSNLRHMLGTRPDDKKLHEMRTIIKQMRYIMSVMRKSSPEYSEAKVSLANLSELEELLGKWHDVVVGIGFLGDFRDITDFKYESEVRNYKILAETLETERVKLRRQIIKSLGKSFCT
jgi:CHAD domain-containing protein